MNIADLKKLAGIGEHNEEILLQYGFENEEIQGLYKTNILTDHTIIKLLSD